MIEINKGGFVGLEATALERLSGCLTCVNQQVFGKKGKNGVKAVKVLVGSIWMAEVGDKLSSGTAFS